MKTKYKNLSQLAFTILLGACFALSASAQHRDGGGSSNSGGSSPRASAPPSGGGSTGGFQRPSAPPQSNNNYSRPSNNGFQQSQRSGIAPQRQSSQQVYMNRGIQARGNYGYAPRTGFAPQQRANSIGVVPGANPRPYVGGSRVNGSSGYRTYPGTGFDRGRESWRNHGNFHYYHGYYNSYYAPRLGFSIGYLPYGYYPFYYGDDQFFYSGGLYYQFNNNEYTVVEPPVGAEIKTLPEKAQSIVINGVQYYELNGVYYQPITKDDGTVVYMIAGKDGELNTDSVSQDTQVAPQIGDIVNQLPPDCRKIKVNGQKLYVSPDGFYYQEQVDANNNKTYKIVGLPSDEPQ